MPKRRPKITLPQERTNHSGAYREGATARWMTRAVVDPIVQRVVWMCEDGSEKDSLEVEITRVDRYQHSIRMKVAFRVGDKVVGGDGAVGKIICLVKDDQERPQLIVRQPNGVKRWDPKEVTKDPRSFYSEDDMKVKFKAACKQEEGGASELTREPFKALILQLCDDSGQAIPTEKELDLSFDLCDLNRNGVIDMFEFVTVFQKIQSEGISGLSHSSAYMKLSVPTSAVLRKSQEEWAKRDKQTLPRSPRVHRRSKAPRHATRAASAARGQQSPGTKF